MWPAIKNMLKKVYFLQYNMNFSFKHAGNVLKLNKK